MYGDYMDRMERRLDKLLDEREYRASHHEDAETLRELDEEIKELREEIRDSRDWS